MEYRKTINFFQNRPNQPSKFRTTKQVELNNASWTTNNANSQTKFKVKLTLRSSLFDHSDWYILVWETITAPNSAADGVKLNNRKHLIIENCAPFTKYISDINNS